MSITPTPFSASVAQRRLDEVVDLAIEMHAKMMWPHGWRCWSCGSCRFVTAIRDFRPDARPTGTDDPQPPREAL